MLTWEFPPIITGGLGMACYGMAKALLKQGHTIDLVMPAKQKVYFPLREPKDVDSLPLVSPNPGKFQKPIHVSKQTLQEIIGSPASVYSTTGKNTGSKVTFSDIRRSNPFSRVFDILSDNGFLLTQVRHYTRQAIDIAKKLDFDVIHAHDWLTYPAGMALRRLCNKPLVVHVHATEFDRAGGPGDDMIHNIEYLGMKYADRVIAVSAYTANLISEKYLVSPHKTRVIHNAYSLPDSAESYTRIFREPTVLFMGRITLQKGPDYFLEVARRVLQRNKNVRFVMAGTGDMERQILHHSAYLGMGTKFLFAGFLERCEVEQILSSADIFILPSISEPFGIAPLEAMNKGVVTIISKNAGVAEVIQNAYKIDFWDVDRMVSAILELIDSPTVFAELSKRARAEVADMSWHDAVKKIVNVFCEIKVQQCLT